MNGNTQGADVPFFLGKREVIAVGDYISRTSFDLAAGNLPDFDVTSAGLPLAWARQVNDDGQVAAFVMQFPTRPRSRRETGTGST